MLSVGQIIAEELNVGEDQVSKAIALMDEGSTVPFIARYRKDVTKGLTDIQLHIIQERLLYLRELEERRGTILKTIQELGKLTPELETQIKAAQTKTLLEDIYRPYKPKKRTKGQIAIEAGLEPLALMLLADPTLDPLDKAAGFINVEKEIKDAQAALDGARSILIEQFAEHPGLVGKVRQFFFDHAFIQSTNKEKSKENPKSAKFKDYFEHLEPIKKIPSHRTLAMLRGRKEKILTLNIILDPKDETLESSIVSMIASNFNIAQLSRPGDAWLYDICLSTWRTKLYIHLETEFFSDLRDAAEQEAIMVFGANLRDLLMSPPAGHLNVIGLDPGIRTGVKIAVVDSTGKVENTGVMYPHEPQNQWQQSLKILKTLAAKHQTQLISIGNGTASRETDKLVTEFLAENPDINIKKIVVSEAGASVYSASEVAQEEFPDMDVSLRGAVSIARRIQDPLSELVKIEPKSIGVGQYQHDVNQTKLARNLDAVVEDCVNAVGVDVNMASVPLLSRIAGLNKTLASNIIEYRNTHGAFKSRESLKKIPRLGDKAFEQAAGFLRIVDGENALDASCVHPESYPIVEAILSKNSKSLKEVMGNSEFLSTLNPADYCNETFGLMTVTDIIKELEKPARDPRPEFKTAQFNPSINKVSDLETGMILEGVVTNVTNFGAFVDVGVHQDGLVHISLLSHKFIKDPRSVVKAGQIVKVKVIEVDKERKRISLSMKLEEGAPVKSAPRPKTNAKGEEGDKGNKPRFTQDREGKKDHSHKRPQHRPAAQKTSNNAPTKSKSAFNSAFKDALESALTKVKTS